MNSLFKIQKWFGSIIAQPLQENQLLPTLAPSGMGIEQEAAHYIAASPTLKPYQRIQLYHQQYWWRLLKCLQSNFPMLLRLFGEAPFQHQLAIPYLTAHPPNDWALCKLGESLPQWLQEHYQQEDRYLVVSAAKIDWAAGEVFWIESLPKIDFAQLSPEKTLSTTLILQPFIHLFALEGDFFTFREEFLRHEPGHYNASPFPPMVYGKYHFVLYRTPRNMLTWKEISQGEFWMLSQFKRGNTIGKVCAQLEEKGGEILEESLAQFPFWFKQWTVLEWFGSSSLSS
jgi:hypothetical protein